MLDAVSYHIGLIIPGILVPNNREREMRHRWLSTLCHHFLVTSASFYLKETESRNSELQIATQQNGYSSSRARDFQLLFDEIWNSEGAFRVDIQSLYTSRYASSEKWEPLLSQGHTQTHCDVPKLASEALTFNGRLLTSMLIKRLSQPLKNTHVDAGFNSELPSEINEHHRLYNQKECQPRIQTFSAGKWILQQTEFSAIPTEFPLHQTHLVLAIPLQNLEGDPESVWILIDKHHLSFGNHLKERLLLLNQSLVSRWFFVSYYLTIKKDAGDEPVDSFCQGMPMVMFMGGFQRSLTKEPQSCLNYFFPSWKLLNAGQLKGAMVYSFLLAFLTEGLFAIRAVVLQHVQGKGRKTLLILLYVLQQAMGYVIMLVAMMYSVELFLSVVLGLAIGHRIFVRGDVKHQVSSITPAPSVGRGSQEILENSGDLQLQDQEVSSYNQVAPELKLD